MISSLQHFNVDSAFTASKLNKSWFAEFVICCTLADDQLDTNEGECNE